jgi:CPA2 family monovalent cation:H+ antiporter-2
MPEIMTASALGVVIAAAMLMDVAGMSYAMGSFLAGVMLAESSYRHEIEANIEPFRGLFLGLFFMAVGLSLDLNVITANWLIILLATPIAMLLKGLAIYAATRMLRNDHNTSVRIALGLVQHGEFGFVLFSAAAATGLLAGDTASTLIPIIAASMALSPLTSKLEHFLVRTAPRPTPNEDYSDANGSVIIIGFGRFGQVVSQPLFAAGNQITILDNDPVRIEDARRFGFRVHYGDGRRRDILRVTGVKDAQAVIICTDKPDVTSEIVQMVQNGNSDVLVYARSFDRLHSIRLYEQRATYTVRETFESALMLSRHALAGLGKDDELVTDIITNIRHRDLKRLRQQAREGVLAGRDQLHVQPVQPEPLSP